MEESACTHHKHVNRQCVQQKMPSLYPHIEKICSGLRRALYHSLLFQTNEYILPNFLLTIFSLPFDRPSCTCTGPTRSRTPPCPPSNKTSPPKTTVTVDTANNCLICPPNQ